jgi:hypothetical protein
MSPKHARYNPKHNKGKSLRFATGQGFQPEADYSSAMTPVENIGTKSNNHDVEEQTGPNMTEIVQEQQVSSPPMMQASVCTRESSHLAPNSSAQPRKPQQGTLRSPASSASSSHFSKASGRSTTSARAELSPRPPQPTRSVPKEEEVMSFQQHEMERAQAERMMEEQRRVENARRSQHYKEYQSRKDEGRTRVQFESELSQYHQQPRFATKHAHEKRLCKQLRQSKPGTGMIKEKKDKDKNVTKEHLPDLEYDLDLERGRWVRRGLYVKGKGPPGCERVRQTVNPWSRFHKTDIWRTLSHHLFAHL